ncbi:integral membrane sensor signal transduction histidine kinase domain protein [Paraburkholderia fungorum]|jgi:hypothetical protein|uniref:Integral membrane sensor signal transduction histidine kinase domain protein n=1 Tax=Paraburkholderia fungorum TaxID=134537 RepID=A0AAU8STC2_9BURK|nr:integral membrane sensor signal transduction histidine kinase domain protein [Paraburkholderia fungorum]PRZ45702.1 hypothetical protein BX589_13772 [Paraburkholderia fungorum]
MPPLLDHDASISAKSKPRLRQIDRAANTLIDLVNTMLLAREESPADIGPVRLASAIETALDLVVDILQSKGIQTGSTSTAACTSAQTSSRLSSCYRTWSTTRPVLQQRPCRLPFLKKSIRGERQTLQAPWCAPAPRSGTTGLDTIAIQNDTPASLLSL